MHAFKNILISGFKKGVKINGRIYFVEKSFLIFTKVQDKSPQYLMARCKSVYSFLPRQNRSHWNYCGCEKSNRTVVSKASGKASINFRQNLHKLFRSTLLCEKRGPQRTQCAKIQSVMEEWTFWRIFIK